MKYFLGILIAFFSSFVMAIPLQKISIELEDQTSLQRGAKIYMNYCSGCHSLKYMRYNKMAEDLGLMTFAGKLDKDLLYNNLVFTEAKPHDPITISMPAEAARQWFGVIPPDLSLAARHRGANWIYTYLKSFYVDESRPFKSNNALFPDVAMPNVLAPLQGEVIARGKKTDLNPNSLVLTSHGTMTEHEFDQLLKDLVTFLVYVAEPDKLVRYHIGFYVVLFFMLCSFVAYRLKKAYWSKLK